MDVQDHSAEPDNDQKLINRAISGDESAYDSLVDRHARRLLVMIRGLVGNQEDAEDLMQETLAQAYFKLDTFAGKSAFFTWLYRIAFNLSVTRRRKRRLESTHERKPMEVIQTPQDDTESAERTLEKSEEIEQLRGAIDRLEDDRRIVLVMRDIDGMDYQEIADLLAIPKGTVRSRLHRARTELRDLLARESR